MFCRFETQAECSCWIRAVAAMVQVLVGSQHYPLLLTGSSRHGASRHARNKEVGRSMAALA